MRFSSNESLKDLTFKFKKDLDKKLKNVDNNIAEEYVNRLFRKTALFEESYKKSGYSTQPDDLTRGDIIFAEFGINIGAELSDYKTHGHYCVCWAIDLGNVIVIPLSSSDTKGSFLTFDLGEIKGLGYDGVHSYLKLDAIRSISKRRISRLPNKEKGKIHLDDTTIEKIRLAIKVSFLE